MQTDISKIVATYKPSKETIELLRGQSITVFAGITGAGKNSIIDGLLGSGQYHRIVTSTTRLPRENNGIMERDGIDYIFLNLEEATDRLQRGEYIEAAWVHEKVYGVLASEIQRAVVAGKQLVMDVDVQGVKTFKSLSDNITAVFVVPPNLDEWIRRAKLRYETDEEFLADWPVRRQSALRELNDALNQDYYHFLVNEDLSQAIASADAIIKHKDKFSQIDKSYRVWVENILKELHSKVEV